MATFVNTATTAPASNVVSFNATMPAGVQAGDLLLLYVSGKYRTAVVPTPTGWTAVTGRVQHSLTTTGNDVGNTFSYVFARIATGSGDQPTVPAPTNTANTWTAIVEAWRPDAGKEWVAAADLTQLPFRNIDDANSASPLGGTAATAFSPQVTAGDALSAFGVAPTDSATGGPASSSDIELLATGLTGITETPRSYVENALGADTAAVSWTSTFTGGTATSAVTATAVLNAATTSVGTVTVLHIREQTAAGGTQHPATGTVVASTTVVGDVTALLPATGAVAATTTVTGDAPKRTAVTGAVAATTTVAGSSAALLPTTGQVAATTTVAGSPAARLGTSGTVAAVSAVAGNASLVGGPVQLPATGIVDASTTVAGAPTKLSPTTGQVAGVSSVAGTPTKLSPVTGQVAATTTVTGAVSARLAASGSVAATTATVGEVAALLAALGTVPAVVGVSGSVTLVPGDTGYVDIVVELAVELLTPTVAVGTLSPTAAVELLRVGEMEVTL